MNQIFIDIKNFIAPNYKKLFSKDFDNDKNLVNAIAFGGRGGLKSSTFATFVILTMLRKPGLEIVCIRKTHNSLRESVLPELIKTAERLGISHLIEHNYGTKTSAISFKITNPQNNQTQQIHFLGVNNPDDYQKIKGYTTTKNKYFGIVWFVELQEFSNNLEIQNILGTFARGEKPFYKVLYEFNPPLNQNHWIYDWLEKSKNNSLILKVNYCDLPIELQKNWLGEEFLKLVNMLKISNPQEFKHIYLGETINLIGDVYPNLTPKVLINQTQKKTEPNFISIGVDYGDTNASSFVNINFWNEPKPYLEVDEIYYHKNPTDKFDNNFKTVDKFAQDLFKFIQKIRNKYQNIIEIYCFVDSAAASFFNFFAEHYGNKLLRVHFWQINKTKKIKDGVMSIRHRITLTNLLLSTDIFKIIKTRNNLLLYEAFSLSKYDKNNLRLDNNSYNLDIIDAFEYAIINWHDELIETVSDFFNTNLEERKKWV